MIGFFSGALLAYVLAGAYIYAIGRPLNFWLSDDKQVTIKAILGWPATVRRVMRQGVAVR